MVSVFGFGLSQSHFRASEKLTTFWHLGTPYCTLEYGCRLVACRVQCVACDRLVDRPTQLICISDIYLSTDKYERHSRVICLWQVAPLDCFPNTPHMLSPPGQGWDICLRIDPQNSKMFDLTHVPFQRCWQLWFVSNSSRSIMKISA